MKTVQHLLSGNKLRLHIVFCGAVLTLLLLGMYFLYLSGYRFGNLLSAGTDCLFFLFCIYTGRWLCQTWYLNNKPALFILCTIAAVAGLALVKWLLVRYVFGHPYAGFIELFRDAMPFFVIGLVMGILLKIIRASIQKELQEAHIQTAQKAMEFSLLQSQLSPHFLFNVLNNLYGISMEEHQRVPPLLLKLSGLLRYAVYGAKKPFVSLKEELVYIRNYLEFEQIRVSDRLVIDTDIVQTMNPDIQIAPLILIVFIENAFKHAKNSLDQKIYISLSLKISGNFLHFTAVNSYREEKQEDSMPDESSGLGLANTVKRLDLLYGNDYQLKQYAEHDQYHVELTLKMQYA